MNVVGTTMVMSMKERLFELVVNNVISNAINIGNQLNLFHHLAQIATSDSPVLPAQLAEAAGCKERYIREWCNTLACGRIIEVNEKEQFWIAPENVEDLTSNSFELVSHGMMPTLLEPLEDLINCFKKDGPFGLQYSQFTKFQEFMGEMSRSLHETHVVSSLLPDIGHGVLDKLKEGVRVLDVGCGNGFHSALLAEQFPNSKFVGLDIGEDAIKQAKERVKSNGERFENLEFVAQDAGKMDGSWTEKFDIVMIFDACHDQMRPDLCIQNIHRVLKKDGVFAMVEVVGSSNVHQDRNTLGPMATLMYGCSMFHCLPVGSNCKDALCYGAMWGRKRAEKLLNDCGFDNIEYKATPYFPINALYIAKK